MADPKKLAEDLTFKAALAAAKNKARDAIEDLTLSEEERAKREEERARRARVRKWKLIGGALLALVLVIAIVALIAHLWIWLLGLAVLAVLGIAAYLYLRPKLATVRQRATAQLEAHRAETAEREAGEAAREAAEAAARAAAAREKQIDDELAALKAKTRE